MMPSITDVEARLAAAGELYRLSESLQQASGAVLEWDDVFARGLILDRPATWTVAPDERAFFTAPSLAVHHVGETYTAAIGAPGESEPLQAVLVGVSLGDLPADALPPRTEGLVVIRFVAGRAPAWPACSLVDSRRLRLVRR